MRVKIILLVFLSVLFSAPSYAQLKVLFDATKAETANNADWVIDADQFNLKYYKNGTVSAGPGNEANAQRFPTPSQKKVTATTKESYWTGALSSWGIDLVKKGFEVETLPYNGKITYGDRTNPQDLSHYAVFVVDEPNIRFTDTEKTAILQFVYHGGGLFMISDHDRSDRNGDGIDSPSIWNDLMQNNSIQTDPFGISFDLLKFDDKSKNVRNLPDSPVLNGTMGRVTELQFFAGTSMTLHPDDNSSVQGLIYRSRSSFGNRNVMFAIATFGKGKVAAMGDSSPADDGTGDPHDRLYDGWIKDANGNHERLIINATLWLAEQVTAINPQKKTEDGSVVFMKTARGTVFRVTALPVEKKVTLSIFDLSGKKILSFPDVKCGEHRSLNIPGKGIYIYRLSGEGYLKTGKFVL